MSKYGLKIKNYQAGSIFEVNNGTRTQYDQKDAMLTTSLFTDFLLENGLKVQGDMTRDIVCINFDYGSRSYEEEVKHLQTQIASKETDEDRAPYEYYLEQAHLNKDKFVKCTKDEIRMDFYTNGVDIQYPTYSPKTHKITGYKTQHYMMLWRTPGKAKKGSCMFICKRLYKRAHDFLTMKIKIPKRNSPVVEIGAYQSLVTSTIVDRIKIDPDQILVIKDVEASFNTNVISVELNSTKQCVAMPKSDYQVTNILFDGQALIDSSIFPEWGDGFILLRHHFCKMAAFNSNIQLFFKDQFGADYDTATVTDMWGNTHLAKDIKLITTENALKWLKFNITYDYWASKVRENGCMFGIVKTAHPSKLGDVQRMSYQMVNALSPDIMDSVLQRSVDYVVRMKKDNNVFVDYLRHNTNFSNDYDCLIALYESIPEFDRSSYFRDRKSMIIKSYMLNLKTGRTIQNADNLTIVGSPYAMLLHSIGKDALSDPTFKLENGTIQCWTNRFENGEYLAEFRNPFNGRNNMGYLHNVHHEYFDRYFNLGKLCIAVNLIGTDFCDRNNGLTKWLSA